MYTNEPQKKGKNSGGSKKRSKKTWGSRERAGMSFLIVVAFFAVFGIIILTEVSVFVFQSLLMVINSINYIYLILSIFTLHYEHTINSNHYVINL